MRRTAIAMRHVHFEDLGLFEPVLKEAGYDVRYHDVGVAPLRALDPLAPDLLVVLGGPVSVYETDDYPFLGVERQMLQTRLAVRRPPSDARPLPRGSTHGGGTGRESGSFGL